MTALSSKNLNDFLISLHSGWICLIIRVLIIVYWFTLLFLFVSIWIISLLSWIYQTSPLLCQVVYDCLSPFFLWIFWVLVVQTSRMFLLNSCLLVYMVIHQNLVLSYLRRCYHLILTCYLNWILLKTANFLSWFAL